MNVIGPKTLPCGHHGCRLPTEPGTYPKRCPTCRRTRLLTVTTSPVLTAKCGTEVLHATWSTND